MPRKVKETPIENTQEPEQELPIVQKTKRIAKKEQVITEPESSDDFEQKIIDKITKAVSKPKPKSEKQAQHIQKLAEIRKGKKMVVIDKDEEVIKEPPTKPKRIIRKKQEEIVEEPIKVVKKRVKKQVEPEIEKPKVKRQIKKKSPEKVVEQQPPQINSIFSGQFKRRIFNRGGLIIQPTAQPTPINGSTVDLSGFSTIQIPASNVKYEHPNRISEGYYKVYNKFDLDNGGGKKDIELANEIKEENRKAEIKQTLLNQQNTGNQNVTNNIPHINTKYPTYYNFAITNNKRPGNAMESQDFKRIRQDNSNVNLISTSYNTQSVLGKRKREDDEIGSVKVAKHSHQFETGSLIEKRPISGIRNTTPKKQVKITNTFETTSSIGNKRDRFNTVQRPKKQTKKQKVFQENTINIPESSGPVSSRTRSKTLGKFDEALDKAEKDFENERKGRK
ncbi:hypothetical protein HDV06_001480 [Boothiomyces sp. JEL0866]|nr:hypothetical protein HDV06_001480 [Boothiomyces sp. JEL0866]